MRPARPFLSILALLLLLVPSLSGLNPELALSQYAHDSWNRHDGLPSGGILCLAQTSDGYIWIGTTAGLVRFDGVTFSTVPTDPEDPESNDPISALCAGPDGSLWIGTRSSGLRVFQNGLMRRLSPGRADPSILSIAVDKNNRAFFGTTTRLYQHADIGDPIALPTNREYIRHIGVDSRQRLWIGTHGSVEYQDGSQWNLRLSAPKLIVTSMLVDDKDTIWVGTSEGLQRWQNNRLELISPTLNLLSTNILTLGKDRHGDIWVGTTKGLHRLRGGQSEGLEERDRFALKHVTAILEDQEGSLWVGTDEGLHRFKDVRLVPWTKQEGLLGNLTPSLASDAKGSVYVLSAGDEHGLTELRNGVVVRQLPIFDGPSCVAKDGSLWIANTGILVNIKDGQVRQFTHEDAVPPVWISTITEDKQGLIVCPITRMGVKRWSLGKLEPWLFADGSPFTAPFHVMSALSLKDGSIAMGTYDGLWILKDGYVTRYTSKLGAESVQDWYAANPQSATCHKTHLVEGMEEYWITCMAEDSRGVLWLGSHRGGLIRFHNGKARTFTTRDGLFSSQIYSVLCDERDNLWLSCPRGIFKIDARQIEELSTGQRTRVTCDVFTSDDGMKTDEAIYMYQPAATKAADGSLWFATKNGVVSVQPRLIERNTTPPPVRIEGLTLDGRPVPNGPLGTPSSPALTVVPAGSEKVDFNYTALSLLVPERVRFRYRLEGYDQDWVEAGVQRTAHYTRLPPGTYQFKVIACNNDGVWNYEGASVSLKVLPHFHQTTWFIGLCLAATGGAVFGAHRMRVRRLRIREHQLQERVDERTAELSKANEHLKREMAERVKAEQEVDRVHKQLMTASHQAGMAEMAAGVLHNIGNVLNSVNVSASVMANALKSSKLPGLARLSGLLREHEADLAVFIAKDPKGRQVTPYLADLAKHLTHEQEKVMEELGTLQKNVDHIKDIVAMQQTYATVSGVIDTISPAELIEDALKMHQRSLERHKVSLVRKFEPSLPPVEVEKHKVLQILVNLIQNAKQACDAAKQTTPTITISLRQSAGMAQITVEDNGIGIPTQNLQRIFAHGFTTKKDGHGFGLHSSALAAKSFGGTLSANSAGPMLGAAFTLEIPLKPILK